MNFLRKILTIAIVAVFTGNTEGMAHPVFDLPDDTPGLLHDRPNKNVCGQRKACVHVVIGNDRTYELVRNINDNNGEVGFDSVADDYQVYFPADGTQPTTEETVEYSCANVDNKEDSPITKWYMMMFGVIPINYVAIAAAGGAGAPALTYVQAGWDNAGPNAQRIISFDASVDGTMVGGAAISRRALFEREFRKIAANPVGRVLLYRILIEIRRHLPHSNKGTEASDVHNQAGTISRIIRTLLDDTRAKSRSVTISAGIQNKFMPGKISLTFVPSQLTVVGQLYRNKNEYFYSVVTQTASIDIGIFHEFGHLYHLLRNIERYYEEARNDHGLHFLNNSVPKYFYGEFIRSSLGSLYFPDSHAISEFVWIDMTPTEAFFIPFEDMRNILGMPYFESDYLQGDDICENLYRANKLLPLRFGYGYIKQYYEDYSVINKEMSIIYNSLTLYRPFLLNKNIDFEYGKRDNHKGLGNCKIKKTDILL